ncbi:MAG: metallophosphoesterase family protein, partial [Desulfuromonadales bacterium]
MTESYFPIPQTPADLIVQDTGGGLCHAQLLELLVEDRQEQWRHKTGVAGAREGSAKSNLRLVLSGGWVLKSHADLLFASEAEAVAAAENGMALAARLQVWHPRKTCFLVRTEGAWWLCSATPRLTILRELHLWDEKVAGWCAMLHLALRMILAHRILLDINPSNFGYEVPGEKLFYIDEETYQPGEVRDVGEAIAHRLPQEPEATTADWRLFGNRLGATLLPLLTTAGDRKTLIDALCDYPLTSLFTDGRLALIEGLREGWRGCGCAPPRPRKVAIISDIHSNLPALEAVLGQIRRLGADSYLFLGDVVGYGPHPRQCLEIVANLPNAT